MGLFCLVSVVIQVMLSVYLGPKVSGAYFITQTNGQKVVLREHILVIKYFNTMYLCDGQVFILLVVHVVQFLDDFG